jgi:hypothetical protein
MANSELNLALRHALNKNGLDAKLERADFLLADDLEWDVRFALACYSLGLNPTTAICRNVHPSRISDELTRLLRSLDEPVSINYPDVLAELRAERVELQGENEALRHDLERKTREAAWWRSRCWLLGVETPMPDDFDPATTVLHHDAPETLSPKQDITELHKRIDNVVELIGTRIGEIVARLVTLEDLAKQRGERLASLEERQDRDDLDRAAGEGMAEPTTRESFYEPQGAADTSPPTINVGDSVGFIDGAASRGLHPLHGDLYEVVALSPDPRDAYCLQVAPVGKRFELYWAKASDVKEVRHAQR